MTRDLAGIVRRQTAEITQKDAALAIAKAALEEAHDRIERRDERIAQLRTDLRDLIDRLGPV